MLSSVEHQSGSAQRFRGLAGALARRGHDVHFLEPAPPDSLPETPAGVNRLACPRLPGRPEWQAPLWLGHGLAAARRLRPDICWCLKALPNAWLPARFAGRGGARVAADLDDLDWAYYPPGLVRSLVARFFRAALRGADDVTVHNETMRALAVRERGTGREPVFVDQGIDVARFASACEPRGLRQRLHLGDGPILLYAGHLGPASDLGPLLPALVPVVRAHPGARLLVVGDGRERGRFEEIARRELPQGFAVFAGTVAHAGIPAYYALADVALNFLEDNEPNRYRASIKLREALAAGLPVVSSATPDTERFREWVRLAATPGPEAFVEQVLAELAEPSRTQARTGAAWLAEHGTYDAAVRGIAERWEKGT